MTCFQSPAPTRCENEKHSQKCRKDNTFLEARGEIKCANRGDWTPPFGVSAACRRCHSQQERGNAARRARQRWRQLLPGAFAPSLQRNRQLNLHVKASLFIAEYLLVYPAVNDD
ncbi:hypothetical protein AcV7_007366 [Taiwanofungus camphoratus]|nr:hypothetical protein AcV7_007366 [Antrodia cinnamomea]